MKKLFLTAALALLCASSYAQLIQSSSLIVTKKTIEPVKRGYQSDIRLSLLCFGEPDQTTTEITYAGGYRFGNALFLGAGVGVNYNAWSGQYVDPKSNHGDGGYSSAYDIPSAEITVPVFAQVRVYFLKKRVSPFIDATGGAMITSKGEIVYGKNNDMTAKYGRTTGYGTLSLGVNCRMVKKSSIYLLVGGKMYGSRILRASSPFEPNDLTADNKPSSLGIGTYYAYGIYGAIGFTF